LNVLWNAKANGIPNRIFVKRQRAVGFSGLCCQKKKKPIHFWGFLGEVLIDENTKL
jgi:hypothetical protein